MESSGQGRIVRILLVEDNPGDVKILKEALWAVRTMHELAVVGDGEQAMRYLGRTGEYAEAPRPDLIFLDLGLPGMSGMEVLAQVKSDPHLRAIPVIVLTSSRAEADIQSAYDKQASTYIPKPRDMNEFFAVVKLIKSYWLTLASLPPEEPGR